jgi:hypothetical protein
VSWQVWSVVPAWVAAVVGAVLVALLAASPLTWLPVVLAAAVVLSFVVQLGIQRKEGLVVRLIASLGGAFLVLLVASAAFALAGRIGL